MTTKELIERIESFKTLGRNWNNEGDKEPNAATINLAKELAPRFDGWFVAPCSDGSILFELGNKCVEVFDS